jgi:hypothetical protein
MQQRTTVMLVTRDQALFRAAAATLNAAGYQVVSDNGAVVPEPDLILRHWVELNWEAPPLPAPVLTLDLSRFPGDSLLHVVERGLGGHPAFMSSRTRPG